jgi:coatomer subunit beta'
VRDSTSRVKLFKNFKEKAPISTNYAAEGIFGGSLLGIKSSTFLIFYDWETGGCVRRVDVVAKNVYWSESDLVVIAGEDGFYVLKFDRNAYGQAVERAGGAGSIPEDGVESAFEFVTGLGVPMAVS